MVHLTTVRGSFHARVVEARLASEGVMVALRGIDEGPYPVGFPVDVLVAAPDLDLAREILLADAVDAAFQEDLAGDGPAPRPSAMGWPGPARRRWHLRWRGDG